VSELTFIRARKLPAEPLDASTHFHVEIVPLIRDTLAEVSELVVWFSAADHTHAAWRLAAIQELAREASPKRVNAIVGDEGDALWPTSAFLKRAEGVTGQVFTLA